MEVVNEKIKWSNLLLALGLTYIGVANWREFKIAKEVYDTVNSTSSTPNKEEKEYIEKIRSEVINKVRESNLFKKFDKQYIIDSLSTIQFKMVDSTISFSKDASATYVYISPLKKKYKYLLNAPESENFIIIKRSNMNDPNYPSVIVHELYHYFDRLITNTDDRYSNIADISKYVDKDIKNEKYAKKKIMALMLFVNKGGEDEKSLTNDIYNDYISSKEYYTSDNELFARYKTLKFNMLKDNIIKDINQTPTIEDLANYLFNIDGLKRLEHLYLLLSIDLGKLKELDSLI